MSTATALTIIAISMGILALLAILAVIFMLRLVLHLIALEKTVSHELGELRQLAAQLRQTTERVGNTVDDVQTAARRIGSAVGAVASIVSFFVRRSRGGSSEKKTRSTPWWLTGVSVGWSLLKRRKKKKKAPRPPISDGSDSSLTM